MNSPDMSGVPSPLDVEFEEFFSRELEEAIGPLGPPPPPDHEEARHLRALSILEEAAASSSPIPVKVTRVKPSGLVVRLSATGHTAFVPFAEVEARTRSKNGFTYRNSHLLGRTVLARVLGYDADLENVVLSLAAHSKATFDSLSVGNVLDGVVTKVLQFGCKVLLDGGIEGLVHRSALPPDTWSVGQAVRVSISDLDRPNFRVGLVPYTPRPDGTWEDIQEAFSAGSSVRGLISALSTESATVSLPIPAKLPASEMVRNKVTVGRDVMVKVLSISSDSQEVIVSERAHTSSVLSLLSPGDVFEGVVTATPVYGVLLTSDELVTGLIHVSTLPPSTPPRSFSDGVRIRAVVIKSDPTTCRLDLALP